MLEKDEIQAYEIIEKNLSCDDELSHYQIRAKFFKKFGINENLNKDQKIEKIRFLFAKPCEQQIQDESICFFQAIEIYLNENTWEAMEENKLYCNQRISKFLQKKSTLILMKILQEFDPNNEILFTMINDFCYLSSYNKKNKNEENTKNWLKEISKTIAKKNPIINLYLDENPFLVTKNKINPCDIKTLFHYYSKIDNNDIAKRFLRKHFNSLNFNKIKHEKNIIHIVNDIYTFYKETMKFSNTDRQKDFLNELIERNFDFSYKSYFKHRTDETLPGFILFYLTNVPEMFNKIISINNINIYGEDEIYAGFFKSEPYQSQQQTRFRWMKFPGSISANKELFSEKLKNCIEIMELNTELGSGFNL